MVMDILVITGMMFIMDMEEVRATIMETIIKDITSTMIMIIITMTNLNMENTIKDITSTITMTAIITNIL